MIHWSCPSCREPLEAPDSLTGDAIECPQCKSVALVPVPMVAPSIESVVDSAGSGAIEHYRGSAAASPHPVEIHLPIHHRRLVITIACALGMAATFMPWVSLSIFRFSGSSGDGWITFSAFFFAMLLTFSLRIMEHPGAPFDPRTDMSLRRRIVICICGVVAIAVPANDGYHLYAHLATLRQSDDALKQILGLLGDLGVGLYLTAICGLIVAVAAVVQFAPSVAEFQRRLTRG